MDENQAKQDNLIDTTDCLEAIGVFRGWKNFSFVIALLCLLLLQASFWAVDQGFIEPRGPVRCDKPVIAYPKVEDTEKPPMPMALQTMAAEEPNKSAKAVPQKPYQKTNRLTCITFGHLCWAICIANGLLILAGTLYCLSILFSLKVSLVGRFGGINHISRAFFLSLITVILLLPWQNILDGILPGVIYTPTELVCSYAASKTPPTGVFSIAGYYLRFCGYWLLAVLFLIFAQIRSSRWSKAVLRRLEVV